MEQAIVGYHRDEDGDWVAELACGHGQHVRHRPPFTLRPWVLEPESRDARLGTQLDCLRCDRGEPAAGGWADPGAEGGESACMLQVLCPECGAVLDGGAHRPGCSATSGRAG